MTAKNKKILFLLTSLTMLCTAVGLIAHIGLSSEKNLFNARAAATTGQITFSGSTVNGTTTTSSSTTSNGGKIKCIVTNNDSSVTSSYVAALKTGTVIRFYEDDGVTEYTFEDVDQFSITKSNSTTKYAFTHYYVDANGDSGSFAWSMSASQTRTPKYETSNITASQFWIECTTTDSSVVYITSLVISYKCTTKYQTGIEVTSMPSKVSYAVGETFNPAGMIISAVYDNGMKVATTSYSYSPNGPLTADVEYITISSGSFSATQAITVGGEAQDSLSELLTNQTFVLTGTLGQYDYELTMDFANGIAYARRAPTGDPVADYYSQTFEYSVDDVNNTISITAVGSPVQTGDSAVNFASRLKVGGAITVTVLNNEITSLRVNLYNSSDLFYQLH